MKRFTEEEKDIMFDALLTHSVEQERVQLVIPRLKDLETTKRVLFGYTPYYSNICYLYRCINGKNQDEDDLIEPPKTILNILKRHNIDWKAVVL